MSHVRKTERKPLMVQSDGGGGGRGGRTDRNPLRDKSPRTVEYDSPPPYQACDTETPKLLQSLNVIDTLARTPTQQKQKRRTEPAQQHPCIRGTTAAATTCYDLPPPYSPFVDGGNECSNFLQPNPNEDFSEWIEVQPRARRGRRRHGGCQKRGEGKEPQNQSTILGGTQDSYGQQTCDIITTSKQLSPSMPRRCAQEIRSDFPCPSAELQSSQVAAKATKTAKEAGCKEVRSVQTSLQKLQVSLQFNKCFEDEAEVKEMVISTIQRPQNEYFRIHFPTIALLHKASKTNCSLIISTFNSKKTERLVARAVVQMRRNIKADITVTMHNGENTEHVETPPEKNGNKEEARPHCPVTIPQAFKVIIDKAFVSPNLFVETIKSFLIDASFNFHVINDSITLADSSTSCVIRTDSKADGKRLKKTFRNALSTEGVNIICHECSLAVPMPETKADDIQSEISEAISCAEVAKEETLRQHLRKIENYQEKLRCFSDCMVEEGLSTFRSRIVRLKYQKIEFLHKCDSLCHNFLSRNPMEVKKEDIDSFLQNFGIECKRLSVSHPIYSWRKPILDYLKQNQVCIVSGDPRSGKSTQVVQYLFDSGYANQGVILSCQPRTSSVVGISEKVARDLAGKVGDLVGYKTETVSKTDGSKTKILFTTETFLLNECLEDPGMKKYSCIVLDEAQEGRVNTNILLVIIKRCLLKRKDLRIIIVESQGGYCHAFANFFDVRKEIRVSGPKFPVDIIHEITSDNFENYEMKAVAKAAEIHSSKNPGDILIFLSTPLEIMRCCNEFERRFYGYTDFKCIPLHDYLPLEEMRKIFEKFPEGVRKIIFASACAESLIPIENVRFVIDSGVTMEKHFDPKRNLRISGIRAISKSSANQRKNLLGSGTEEKCYRLYSEDEFDSLPTRDTPEIHRANLGQMLLKLIYMGVDIHSFEFPQAPKEATVDAAVQTLVRFGAVADNKITDLGKWISRLPFDVANNCLVYEATKVNLTYDAIVLATLMYYNSDIDLFYFPLCSDDPENVAICRGQLSSSFGDVFTFLTVFKTWSHLRKVEKAEWCRQNGINYKTLGFIRNFIDEVLTVMRENMNTEVAKRFSNRESDMELLRKIIFNINIASVCRSVDEHRDRFSSLVTPHIVTLHPKNSLVFTDTHPRWIIFTDLLRTSREYIKGVIVAKEEWVQEAEELEVIKVDHTERKQQLVYHGDFGHTAFTSIVGPFFRRLWKLEEKISEDSNSACVLEADQDFGILNIYSNCILDISILDDINSRKSSALEQVRSETFDFTFKDFSTSDLNSGKISIGQGGVVEEYINPAQGYQLNVSSMVEGSLDDIVTEFEQCGQVTQITRVKGNEGVETVEVTFRSTLEAFIAFECTAEDSSLELCIRDGKEGKPRHDLSNSLLVKLSWFKPSVKVESHAVIECSPLDRPILIGHSLELCGNVCEINVSPDDAKSLIIMGIGSSTKEDIEKKLTKKLREQGRASVVPKVFIIKCSSPQIDSEALKDMKGFLHSLLQTRVQKNEYLLYSPLPSQNLSRYYVCYVRFYNLEQGERVCREMNRRYEIDGQEIEFRPSFSTVLRVAKIVKEMCHEQLSNVIDSLTETYERLSIKWKHLGEDFAIEIECPKHEPVQRASARLSTELQGEIVDCSVSSNWWILNTQWGQNRLQMIQHITGCVAVTDTRNNKIHCYGSKSSVRHAIDEINNYVSEDLQVKHISLQSPGLMLSMLREYGPTLDGLVEDCRLDLAQLDISTKSLQVFGSPSALENAADRLMGLKNKLKTVEKTQQKVGFPVCSVCRGIAVKGSFCRLEMCNHLYCFDCLSSLANAVIKNYGLPMVCIDEECDAALAARDVAFIIAKRLVTKKDFIASALSFGQSSGLNVSIQCCPTMNCPMYYNVSHEKMGEEFVCPLCMTSVCTACHKPFHRGMPCV